MTDISKPGVSNADLDNTTRIENLEILVEGAFAAVHDLGVVVAMLVSNHPISDKTKENLVGLVHGCSSVMEMSAARRGSSMWSAHPEAEEGQVAESDVAGMVSEEEVDMGTEDTPLDTPDPIAA